jgi:hypothetical protein
MNDNSSRLQAHFQQDAAAFHLPPPLRCRVRDSEERRAGLPGECIWREREWPLASNKQAGERPDQPTYLVAQERLAAAYRETGLPLTPFL